MTIRVSRPAPQKTTTRALHEKHRSDDDDFDENFYDDFDGRSDSRRHRAGFADDDEARGVSRYRNRRSSSGSFTATDGRGDEEKRRHGSGGVIAGGGTAEVGARVGKVRLRVRGR
jgi:hypothetical protein